MDTLYSHIRLWDLREKEERGKGRGRREGEGEGGRKKMREKKYLRLIIVYQLFVVVCRKVPDVNDPILVSHYQCGLVGVQTCAGDRSRDLELPLTLLGPASVAQRIRTQNWRGWSIDTI